MRRLLLTLSLLSALATAAYAADRPLIAWEFNRPGDTGGWYAAHSLSKPTVAGGILRTRATSGDPYLISSAGDGFDVTANDFQYIEVRMSCNKAGSAEFFWASTTEGKDAGFVAGKERPFDLKGDNRFHTYRLFPVWQGKITRLRLDPPDGVAIGIDYIRVMQAPVTRHAARNPRWDFAAEAGGGFVPTTGCSYDTVAGGLKVILAADNATLTGPAVDLPGASFTCATLHTTASAPMQLLLNWSATGDGTFPGSQVIPLDLPAGEQWTTIRLVQAAGWSGPVRRLALGIAGHEGQSIVLHSFGFGVKPEGPARLTLLSLAADRCIYAAGEPIQLHLRARNDGGAPARAVTASLSSLTPSTLAGAARTAPVDLEPGGLLERTWTLRAMAPGSAAATVRLAGVGLFRPAGPRIDLMVTRPAPRISLPAERAGAVIGQGGAAIGTGIARLTFIGGASGIACARLDLVQGRFTRTMGALPHLARVALNAESKLTAIAMQPLKATNRGDLATLTFRGARGPLSVDLTFTARTGQPWIDSAYRVTTSRATAIRAFQGTWLWAGEGSFADQQDHALFPGVEWLVKGERSSTPLDIAPPAHVRWAPHPNWVTVPSVAVEQGGAIAGVMWDPLQKWDGVHTRPSAAFASPNFVEGKRNHLVGLFLPGIPGNIKPNSLLAFKPCRLKPGGALTLESAVYTAGRTEITAAPLLWYVRYCGGPGRVPSMPRMARGYDATIDMSMTSFEKVLWKPESSGWQPVVGWAPGPDPGVAALYLTTAQLLANRPEATAWLARAKQVGLPVGDITFAMRGTGSPEAALRGIMAQGQGNADAQPEGARYAFHPEGSRVVLGPDGGTAIGIAAAPVESLVWAALRTGDEATIQAALKGLAFMDQFDVPRASQVWECPLHSPDILASGQACRAYLGGYRLTGDRKYLERAIFWARTGLPFVYSWQAPEMPGMMKYATIPIFGATFYTGSWFGVPVQWNGLDYAYGCLELAPYDPSFPWRAIGEGITISGINQQSTRKIDYGTYTDNWNMVTNVECVGCMLSPNAILANVYRLKGISYTSGCDGVRTSAGWIAVNGPGVVRKAALQGGVLTAEASHIAGTLGVVAVMPIRRPSAVLVDGQPLSEANSDEIGPGQWRFNPNLGLVTLGVQFGQAPLKIEVRGVERSAPVAADTNWDFRQGGGQGWTTLTDMAVNVAPGSDPALRLRITGGDPYVIGPPVSVATDRLVGIALRARSSKPDGQLFWGSSAGTFNPKRCVNFALPADGQFHDVMIDLAANPEWRGTLRQLRLDFNGTPGDTVELQWVRVIRK